jgi:hypothetical protein
MIPGTEPLAQLLRHRLTIIADHDLRVSDPQAQLAALQAVSEDIAAWLEKHRAGCPPKLRHFIEQASLQKALEYIEASA